MNLFECPFSLHARKRPKAIALLSSEEEWTYATCEALISGIAAKLKELGVKSGDVVALLPTKLFPTPLLFFALFRLGAIACPLNIYHPLESLPKSLDDLGASLILYPDALTLPKLKQIALPFSKCIRKGKSAGQTFLDKKALATYLFTSGTTASPKIACHTLSNHYYSALGSNAYMPLHEGDRYFLSLPLYHIAGIAILFRTFLAGGAVALDDGAKNITHVSFVPTQLFRLLKQKNRPSYKKILLGGADIPYSLYMEAIHAGLPVCPSYGMTEMSSQIATHFSSSSFSLGHPLPYRDIKIGNEGEILVKGKTLFQGYLQKDGTLALPLDEEGFFATKDLGSYCPKRGLFVRGRKDRLFISGGENIQPEEIERHLKNIQGIIRAKVVPVPDKEFGHRPKAFIESEKDVNEEELKAYLSSLLPKFKIPTSFVREKNIHEDPQK
ncbi:MAG: o-succinylbenzoate--CoA ligase [Chlamydiia bacterium]|nr:o-succinylbenzoate--CoA ligase [Chlamydiia bacterium]